MNELLLVRPLANETMRPYRDALAHARIAELEAALVEACDGWSHRDYDHLDVPERNAQRELAGKK